MKRKSLLRRRGVLCFFLFLSLSSSAGEKDFSWAKKGLEKVLKNYRADSLIIPVKQDIFLSVLKMNLTSEGKFFLKGEKFRLELKGKPSSLTIFDGVFFWHQPDLKEKLVFRIKKPSETQKLSSFFETRTLFQMFEIMDLVSRKSFKIYQLKPKKKIQDLKELFMKTDQRFLLEIRFTWENLNTWQKYTFSKPVFTEIPSPHFEWTQKGYRVLEKEDF